MTTERYSHSCTTLPSGEVMVANGSNRYGNMKSVEIYDPNENTWRYGVETPEWLSNGKMVLTNQNEPLIVTGYFGSYENEDRLFKFSNGEWIQLNITLKSARDSAFVHMVPVQALNCCQPYD